MDWMESTGVGVGVGWGYISTRFWMNSAFLRTGAQEEDLEAGGQNERRFRR